MPTPKGRATEVHVCCSECGVLYRINVRLVESREESDVRIAAGLRSAGWTGNFEVQGAPLTCHRCNKRPPSAKVRPAEVSHA